MNRQVQLGSSALHPPTAVYQSLRSWRRLAWSGRESPPSHWSPFGPDVAEALRVEAAYPALAAEPQGHGVCVFRMDDVTETCIAVLPYGNSWEVNRRTVEVALVMDE